MEPFQMQNITTLPTVNFVREGLKMGLINGAIALLIMYGGYFMGLDTFVNVQFISRFVPYMMLILILYGFQLRKRQGGYLALKDGLQYAFMSYVISTLLIAAGTYILFNLVDKDLTVKVYDIAVEKTRRMMESLGQKSDEIEKEISKMGTRESQQTGIKTIFLGVGIDLITGFVMSLVISLIIRKEKRVQLT
jgi:hypothetical protein